jgi:hypothetical protein
MASDALDLIRSYCELRLSQRRRLAERYGVQIQPGEPELEWMKRTVKAVGEQGKQDEFKLLIAEAKK